MKSYKERMIECMDHLNSIRFPCADWKEDKVYFDRLEHEFSAEPADEEEKEIFQKLRTLIYEKRMTSLNCNKTAEELFAGWNDD